ncbi:hypothetical protein AB0A71_18055 [Kitasatospora aureofaciens]|uniref:hypothetical protein n=1 Tax=Kitasatospora aureofaciens TaxID=1894 RepID=UPI0033EBDC61
MDADRAPDRVRAPWSRLLGDRGLQPTAWTTAEQPGHPGTPAAEHLAPTRLQADAPVTPAPEPARAAKDVVTLAPVREPTGRP